MPGHGARHAQLHGRPSSCAGGEVDHRADLFSLGVVLYEMLTGRPPFQADTMADDRRPHPHPGARRAGALQLRRAGRRRRRRAQGAGQGRGLPLPVGARALRRPAPRPRAADPRVDGEPALDPAGRAPATGRIRAAAASPAATAGRTVGGADLRQPDRQSRRRVDRPGHRRVVDRRLRQGARAEDDSPRADVRPPARVEQRPGPHRRRAAVDRAGPPARRHLGGRRGRPAAGRSGARHRADHRRGRRAQRLHGEDRRHDGSDLRSAGQAGGSAGAAGPAARAAVEREARPSSRMPGRPRPTRPTRAACSTCASPPQESADRAIALFERALELDPGYLDALIALGGALQLRGSFLSLPHVLERSKALLEKAVAIAPENSEAHVRLGADAGQPRRHRRRPKPRSARDSPWSPTAPWPTASSPGCCGWAGPTSTSAIAHFTRAAELAPQARLHLPAAGPAARHERRPRHRRAPRPRGRRPPAARDVGTQGLLIVGAHTRLGYVHYLRGHYEEAIREYRRELNFLTVSDHALRDRSIIEVSQKLSAAYLRLGSHDEARTFGDGAIEAFDRRLAAGADDASTRYYIADAATRCATTSNQCWRISSARCGSWARSRAGACRATPTSRPSSPIPRWRRGSRPEAAAGPGRPAF